MEIREYTSTCHTTISLIKYIGNNTDVCITPKNYVTIFARVYVRRSYISVGGNGANLIFICRVERNFDDFSVSRSIGFNLSNRQFTTFEQSRFRGIAIRLPIAHNIDQFQSIKSIINRPIESISFVDQFLSPK